MSMYKFQVIRKYMCSKNKLQSAGIIISTYTEQCIHLGPTISLVSFHVWKWDFINTDEREIRVFTIAEKMGYIFSISYFMWVNLPFCITFFEKCYKYWLFQKKINGVFEWTFSEALSIHYFFPSKIQMYVLDSTTIRDAITFQIPRVK